MNISERDFTRALKNSWSRETSGDPEHRSDTNPSYRQCLITALLANEFLKFDIYTEVVHLESGFRGEHYFNFDNDKKKRWDFCDEQFAHEKVLNRKRERKLLAQPESLKNYNESIRRRYDILKQKFQTEIQKVIN